MSERDDDRVLTRTTVMLPESLVDLLDGAIEDAPDWLSLSRSELIRHAIETGTEQWDEDVLDLVPDELLARYRTIAETQRIQAKHYVVDKREGWRGRVKSYLNARLAGEEPYHPAGIEILAQGYEEELRTLDSLAPDSSRTLGEDLEWLEAQIDAYRDAYVAKEAVPDPRPFEGVEQSVEIGSDLLSLQGNLGDMVAEIGEIAASTAYDADAILDRLAIEYAVDREAVEIVLDVLLPDDVDPRKALKDLESTTVDEILPPEAVEEVGDPELVHAETIADEDEPIDMLDDATAPLTIRAEDLDGDDPHVDPEEVERIVNEEIRADGGDLDD